MRNPNQLTRAEVLRAARDFEWTRKMPKWRVVVEDRELPARPLVLEAAGVPPNDPTNSHQAVAILENLGFETRYAARGSANGTKSSDTTQPSEGPIGRPSIFELIAEITKDMPDEAWSSVPTDLAKNIDHYLYGHKKIEE